MATRCTSPNEKNGEKAVSIEDRVEVINSLAWKLWTHYRSSDNVKKSSSI